MAVLTVNAITQAGIYQSAAAVAADVAGDSVKAASGLFFQVFNANAGARVVTIAKPKAATECQPFGTLNIEDIVITIPASEDRSFTIPLGFANASGDFAITYDAVDDTTVAVFSLA